MSEPAASKPRLRAVVRTVSSRLSHATILGLIAVSFVSASAVKRSEGANGVARRLSDLNDHDRELAPTRAITVLPPPAASEVVPDTARKTTPPAQSASQSNVGPHASANIGTGAQTLRAAGADAIVPPVDRIAPRQRLSNIRDHSDGVADRPKQDFSALMSAATKAAVATQSAALSPSTASPDAAKPPPVISVVRKSAAYTVVHTWSDAQISEARTVCETLLRGVDMVATDVPAVSEGACGAPAPIDVKRVGKPKVDLQPSAMLTCPMAAALNTWITDKVQPAAIESFSVPVVRLISASSYACRNRYGRNDAPLSEHALVNALDLSGFVLADGRTVRVVDSWGPVARDAAPDVTAKPAAQKPASTPVQAGAVAGRVMTRAGLSMLGGNPALTASKTSLKNAKPKTAESGEQNDNKKTNVKDGDKKAVDDAKAKRIAFLHRVHREACDVFGTVLGPEANDAHRNHFHLDMKARRGKAYCQ